MFDWNDQDQIGDTIWAEFNENEDHIVPYPKGMEDGTLIKVGNQKKKNAEAASILGLTERTSGAQADFPGLEKQSALQTSGQHSATRLDMESWPDLPSLNAALGRNYSNDGDQDNLASTYLDFSAAPSLEKVGGNTAVQLDGEPEVFGNDHEEKSNNLFDCDWGNIGDFDDFDCLFSNSDSIYGNEMVADGDDFLSTSPDVISSTVQSIPIPHMPLNKEQSSDHGSSLLQINEPSGASTKQENKVADANAKSGEQAECKNHMTSEYSGKPSQFSEEGDVQKRLVRSCKKPVERGKSKASNNISGFSQNQGQHPPPSMRTLVKAPTQSIPPPAQHTLFHDGENMGQVGHANQFMFSGYGYPAYPFPTIPLMPNIQAEGHQTKPAATSYGTLTDSSKRSSSSEKPPDIPSRPLMMTPQEKIEKLRRRQQMQAMLAIQQQQQQFGHQVSGSDTLVPQAYSPRNKNPDSLGTSIVIDEAVNKVFSPELNILTVQEELQKSSVIPDDPFIEEKIYYQLQDALGKLDTRIRLCIRDSLLRLAQSATERRIASDRSSTNKSNKDEDEVSENDTSNRRKRSLTTEAETDTNPIDRIVAHLLFHRHCSKFVMPAKEEISSTPLSFDPESKVPTNTPGGTSDQQNGEEMEVQPSL